ncbi:hypothetical protein EPN44_00930 [bacterium]|nr:MAG: hypothetical protein EPN44_00930 [bacterium]
MSGVPPLAQRVEALPWEQLERDLWLFGAAKTPPLLTPQECEEVRSLYREEERFRKTVVMARHNFGEGEYRYFAYPLPPLVQALRETLYGHLAPVASAWAQALRENTAYPATLEGFLARCRSAGQHLPTPLLLTYGAGGWNALHQDLYGDIAFPLQVTCFLSRPDTEYQGGEFLLVEQRPRAQSRGEAFVTAQGELVIFATRYRPLRGVRGYLRAALRHGVGRVRSGARWTLGIVFHDAR